MCACDTLWMLRSARVLTKYTVSKLWAMRGEFTSSVELLLHSFPRCKLAAANV